METSRNRYEKGRFGEAAAREYLIKQGFKVIEAGFRCRFGEIDLIAAKGTGLYFIEVKTRWGAEYGSPFDAVDLRKQRQIIRVADLYLSRVPAGQYGSCHLSVIGVNMAGGGAKIEFMPDAFETQAAAKCRA